MNKTRFPLAVGLWCAALMAISAFGQSSPLTFQSANIVTGNGPAMAIPVDINGDGHPGLVGANFGFAYNASFSTGTAPPNSGWVPGTTLLMFTNDGHGNLSLSDAVDVGKAPVSVATADFNGDGKADVVCGNVADSTIMVLTNAGKGHFTVASTNHVGTNPLGVTTADVNGDGYPDIITANYSADTLTILTNNGRGGFSISSSPPVGAGPGSVAAADVNGDGFVDLVCANSAGGTMTVLTNNGKGIFKQASLITVTGGTGTVAAADLNHDGSIDLVTVLNGAFSVFTNTGSGTFVLASEATSSGASALSLVDMNDDGRVDVVCNNNGNGIQGSMTVLTNDGKGNFTANTSAPVGDPNYFNYVDGNYPNFVATADFSGDGNQDVAVSCYGTALITELVQTNLPALPTVSISSPLNDSVISSSGSLSINTLEQSQNPIEVVIFYADGKVIGVGTNAPFGDYLANVTGVLAAGSHTLQAEAIDSQGNFAWSPQSQLIVAGKTGGPKPPTIKITSPANGATIASDTVFTFKAAVTIPSDTTLGVVNLFYDETNFLLSFFNTPITCPIYPGTIPPGRHTLGAYIIDNNGLSASASINIDIKPVSSGLTVAITSPTNGQPFSTTDAIKVKSSVHSTGSLESLVVELFADGTNIQQTVFAPYSFTIPGGFFRAGEHTLVEVANGVNGLATSAVTHITINTPGTSVINFDALDTTAGAVSGATLAGYLGAYGVKVTNATVGTTLEAVNQNNFTGTVAGIPSSPPNLFTQAGASGPVSFTLLFAQPLQELGFTRVELSSPDSAFITHPAWTATAFDASGNELSAVSEGLILTNDFDVAARTFTLVGNGIASVTFSSDGEGLAEFPAVLLDDLYLNQNPVTSPLSVTLQVISPSTENIVSPATVVLGATVVDPISTSYSVSFYTGLNLLGTASAPPYQVTWTNALAGRDNLHATVTDSSGLSAISPIVPITVKTEPYSTVISFENLPTKGSAVTGTAVRNYLAKFGVAVSNLSGGTMLAVDNENRIGGGKALTAASGSNVLTQVGSNGPVAFTLDFTNQLLTAFQFTRPKLLANPFVSFPAWRVTAYDGAGAVVDTVARKEIDSAHDVGTARYLLAAAPGGPGIAKVEFFSAGTGLTTFGAMVVDDLILTTNPVPFAPAVAITKPANNRVLTMPPSVAVAANAADATGILGVTFYATTAIPGANNVTFDLGTATAPPYQVEWQPGTRLGTFILTAVAANDWGFAWTSAPVTIRIAQPATQFGILSAPADQTVPVGASATFTVVPSGTNGVTYQWSAATGNSVGNLTDNAHISGANSPTLTINPPITDLDAGLYAVTVTSGGVSIPATANLTVIDPPTITQQPLGQTVTSGTTVLLSPSAGGIGPFTWQWLLNGTPIPGATNRVYSILAAQALQSGNYQVTVANQVASAVSAIAPVVVLAPQTIPFTNDNFANAAVINPLLGAAAGSNVLATTEPGEPALAGAAPSKSIWFAWKPSFTGTVSLTTAGSDFDTVMAVYTGTTLKTLKLLAADDDSGGFLTSLVTFNVTAGTTYHIAVDGFQGAAGRVVLGFPPGNGYRILNPLSGDSVPVIVRQPASRVAPPNATVTLSVAAVSATKATYQWLFQGTPIAGATGASLTIKNFQAGSVGLYQALVANQTGSVLSEAANLQIANDAGTTPSLTQNKLLTGGGSGAKTPALAAFNLTPLAAGSDTRGFTVSQVFSTVGSTAEPGEPQPCGQVPGGSQWFVYKTQISGTLEVDTRGSTYNTLVGVYTGDGSSFADLTEVGCGYATNFEAQGQPKIVIPGVPAGETFYIVIDGYQGDTGLADLHIGLGAPLTLGNMPANLLATAGSNVTLRVNAAAGSLPSFYEWQLNGLDLPGGTGGTKSTYTVTNAQADAVGNYSVIVSNAVGVVTSSPPTALTLQYAPLIVTQPTNETVLLGHPAKFAVTAIGVNVKTNAFACQWYSMNYGAVAKATGLTLTIPVTHWTNNDSFYCVISNRYGTASTTPARLIVLDTTLPSVLVKFPKNNFTSTTNPVTITGMASDNVGIKQVMVQPPSSLYFQSAVGSNNWSFPANLAPGPNTFAIRSVDLQGNVSKTIELTIDYSPPTSGGGDVVKALAAPVGGHDGARNYIGLFLGENGAAVSNAGYFTATVARNGRVFTAQMLVAGECYRFDGAFDATGLAQVTIHATGDTELADTLNPLLPSVPSKSPLQVTLQLGENQMTGEITDGIWRSTLRAEPEAWNDAPSVAGKFIIVDSSEPGTPVGSLALGKTAGLDFVSGTLMDGGSVFLLARASTDRAVPLYAPLYSGKGLFLGWITSASGGQGVWIKPGAARPIDILIVEQISAGEATSEPRKRGDATKSDE